MWARDSFARSFVRSAALFVFIGLLITLIFCVFSIFLDPIRGKNPQRWDDFKMAMYLSLAMYGGASLPFAAVVSSSHTCRSARFSHLIVASFIAIVVFSFAWITGLALFLMPLPFRMPGRAGFFLKLVLPGLITGAVAMAILRFLGRFLGRHG